MDKIDLTKHAEAILEAAKKVCDESFDDMTPSSVMRDRGHIWVDGWVHPQAILTACAALADDAARVAIAAEDRHIQDWLQSEYESSEGLPIDGRHMLSVVRRCIRDNDHCAIDPATLRD